MRTDGPQALGLGMGGVVEGEGVLQGQEDGVWAHPLQGGLVMGVANGFGIEVIIFKEAIGPLGGGTRTAGLRDGRRGLLGEGSGDHQDPGGAAIVAQFGMAEFGESPIGRMS